MILRDLGSKGGVEGEARGRVWAGVVHFGGLFVREGEYGGAFGLDDAAFKQL